MNSRENIIRAYRMRYPERIPVSSGLPFLDWEEFGYDPDELDNICERHPLIFPGFRKGDLIRNHENVGKLYPDLIKNSPYTDFWGCVWETKHTGMVGAVVFHPLTDPHTVDLLRAPDPDKSDGLRAVDWAALAGYAEEAKHNGGFFALGLPHGHTFLRAQDLMGYENLILNMADENPEADKVLDVITEFNLELIKRMIQLGPDMILTPEDLGMQNGPMLSPAQFRKYIAPRYGRIIKPVKEAGVIVHFHSDGYIMPLIEDILKSGADVINLQDLVNGLDNIAGEVKGRAAIDLDIDRQNITVHGSLADIDSHIKECVYKLSAPEGGLSLCYQPWPPTPAGNLDAVFGALEKYCITEYRT